MSSRAPEGRSFRLSTSPFTNVLWVVTYLFFVIINLFLIVIVTSIVIDAFGQTRDEVHEVVPPEGQEGSSKGNGVV